MKVEKTYCRKELKLRASSLKLISIVALVVFVLGGFVQADNETTSVVIILKEHPVFGLHEKALEKRAQEIESSQKIIKGVLEKTHGRIVARKENRKNLLEEMTDSERTTVASEALKIRTIKLEARKEAIREAQNIISPKQDALGKKIVALGGRVKGRGLFFNVLFAEVPSYKVAEISGYPEVESVENSRTYKALLDVGTKAIFADAFWNASYNGTGVQIAIVDTGVNASHPGISSRVVDARTFVASGADSLTTDDLEGHGTHVAGIASSTDSTYKGVAFGASIINAKAGDLNGSLTDAAIVNAMDWAIYNATGGAEIISASFGGSASGYGSLARFFDAVFDLGIFISVAAGNDGTGTDKINSPGTSYSSMTIGAVDDQNTISRSDDSIASYSSRGPITDTDRIKPDIVAPGSTIVSLSNTGSGFVSKSGTSMATPHISGVAALLIQAGVTDPKEIKALLINTAEDKGNAGPDNDYGWGYVDLNQTLNHLSDVRLTKVNTTTSTIYYKGYAFSGERATITWNKHQTYSGPSGDYSSGIFPSDIDLYLYRISNGAQISNSTRQYSNVEQVQSNVNDTVVVKITVFSFATGFTNETLGLATGAGYAQTSPPSLNASLLVPKIILFNRNETVEANITNTGGLSAHNITAKLNLPSGLSVLSANPINVGSIANGSYSKINWTIKATSAGNYSLNVSINSTSYGEIITINASNTTSTESNPPTIALVLPQNTTYYDGQVPLNFTAEDASGVSSVWYNLNNGANTTISGNTRLSLCSSAYTLRLYANDTAGNINSTSVGFTVSLIQNLNTSANYTSIQVAINNASVGDAISVGCGAYNENVKINKSVSLRGASASNTTISAANKDDHVLEILANLANVSGLMAKGANGVGSVAGIYVNLVNNTNISGNFVTNNTYGIFLQISNNNRITVNNASMNTYGIYVKSSKNNSLEGNNATSNNYGIFLDESSVNNTLINNSAISNNNGIRLGISSNNTIFHNNFVNNTNQSFDDSSNTWDNSYPSGGNYWSDYDNSSEGCLESNNDGVCDYPHNISGGGNRDRYPVNRSSGWLFIVEDATAPTVIFVPPTPANNSLINRSFVFVNVTLGENGNTTLEWDGTNNTMQGAYANWFLNQTGLVDGNHAFRVFAQDVVGNRNATSLRNITVDATPPSVTNLTITPRFPEVGALVNITVNVTESTTSVTVAANLTYPNGTVITLILTPGSIYNYTGFNASIFGKYNVTIIANDSAENVNSSVRTSFSAIRVSTNASNVTNGTTASVLNITSNLDLLVTANESLNATISLTATVSPSADIFGAEEINSSNAGVERPVKYVNATNLTVIENVSKITLRVYYNDSEISGLDEDSLSLLFWNGSRWLKVSDYVGSAIPGGPNVSAAGISKSDNYVYADLNHLSVYGLGGSVPVQQQQQTTTSSGGGGGGGGVTCIVEGVQSLDLGLMDCVIKDLGLKFKFFYSVVNSIASIFSLVADVSGEWPAPKIDISSLVARPITAIEGDVYELAVVRVKKAWPTARALVVARGDLEVDSMAALAYAKVRGYPILLTKPDVLPSVVEAQAKALTPGSIIIAGGPVAVSSAVESQLSAIAPVERIAGKNREETAVELARAVEKFKAIDIIVIADGLNPNPEAALLAAGYRAPIIYVTGDALPQVTRDFLADHKVTQDAFKKKMKVVFVGVSGGAKGEVEALMR